MPETNISPFEIYPEKISCPFCGMAGVDLTVEHNNEWSVVCLGCGCGGPTMVTYADAIVAWNLREKS
jgi:transcription elongation factor Elf1